ncbi:MAG: AAA family ATPase [Spirochaetales bacterium]|nr:AAA family ATPase [Candidatus Physcosoma equi]
MFIGRERELQLLQEELQKDGASAILIYGRRRVGKTTLIKKAADAFSGKTINMEGIAAKMAVNIKMMADLVADTFEEPSLPFTSFKEIFD